MNRRLLVTAFSLITMAAIAADLSNVTAQSIAKKKELLFPMTSRAPFTPKFIAVF